MKLIATTPIKFCGTRIEQDQEFDASDKDAQTLIKSGLAQKAQVGNASPSKAVAQAPAAE
jgi:hypothetical protein